jgi:GT2 family glycosyltransferase
VSDQHREPPFVSVIVPTHRRPDAVGRTLETIAASDYPKERFEIIVVDDGSGDETSGIVEALSAKLPNLRYLAQENRGAAAARNNGARAARGEILLFNDDDILLAPDAMPRHVANLVQLGRVFTNGHWEFEQEMLDSLQATPFGRYRIALENWIKTGVERTRLPDGRAEASDVTACSLGAWRSDFLKIGGFDERFPFAGAEDQDLSIRGARGGIRLIADPSIRLWHDDRRLSLRQFCERHRRGAISAAVLAGKYPAERGGSTLITENRPVRAEDGLRLRIKKSAKRLLSLSPSLALFHAWIEILERIAPESRLLARCYRMVVGVYIYMGINEGLRRHAA